MIEISHLTKRYGDQLAVSDLNLTIDSGQVYGFLGPNGAGKSTTMNIMTGCLAATEGQVRIDGYDIFEQAAEAKKLIGYLPEQPPLYPDMTPEEYLKFVGQAKGLRGEQLWQQIDQSMELTRITDVKDRLIRNLSKGYRQRVGIAQAILGSPQVIILDEPTVGLDPLQIIEIRDLIESLGKTHTVILSSHILSEVQAVCDHIMILSRGKLVASDTPENLETLFQGAATLELTVKADPEETRALLEPVAGVASIRMDAAQEPGYTALSVEAEPGRDLREDVFFAFSAAGKPIVRMNQTKASLEEIFLELTAEKPAEEPEEQPEESEVSEKPDEQTEPAAPKEPEAEEEEGPENESSL